MIRGTYSPLPFDFQSKSKGVRKMNKIYIIKNNINSKVYIGKTQYSIEQRFKEHCNDYLKRGEEKRPLYSAMRKFNSILT